MCVALPSIVSAMARVFLVDLLIDRQYDVHKAKDEMEIRKGKEVTYVCSQTQSLTRIPVHKSLNYKSQKKIIWTVHHEFSV